MNIEIIEPKCVPPFILELTKLDKTLPYAEDTFMQFYNYFGRKFDIISSVGESYRNCEAVYCVIVPDPIYNVPQGISVAIDPLGCYAYMNSVRSSPVYSGKLLFDIPSDPNEDFLYFGLVAKSNGDPYSNMPPFPNDAPHLEDYYLTGRQNTLDENIYYEWKKVPTTK
jgi:hypothetical protein